MNPTQETALSCDIDGLLDGLGDDDFNFDLLSSSQPQPKSDGMDPFDEFLSPTPVPSVIPATVAFGTASGKRLRGPSEAALQRAQKLMREAEREVEEQEAKRRKTDQEHERKAEEVLRAFPPQNGEPSRSRNSMTPQPSNSGSRTGSRSPSVHHAESTATPKAADTTPPALGELRSPTTGFTLASGGSAPQPNAASLEAARRLFDEPSTSQPSSPASRAGPSQHSSPQRSAGFTLGSGRSAPQPSAASLAAARKLFDEPAPGSPKPPPTSGFLLGSGRSAPQPSAANLARARALFDDEPSTASVERGTPARAPLRATTNTFETAATATPVKTKLGSIGLGSPATPRRIGLGSPAARGRRKPFVSPFKTPGAARPLPGSGLRAPALVPPKAEKIWKPVFDLTLPPGRQSMRQAGLQPGQYSISDLRKQEIPSVIWELDVDNAACFEFYDEDEDTRLGTRAAFDALKAAGAELATERWVTNHWCLILWKLAAQVRAKPSLIDEKFAWAEVIRQLKYRYEREYGNAQRPIVRRIQEQDSPAGLAMVLCVSRIHRPEPVRNEKDQLVPQQPYLSLTDGWYHIKAFGDECISRAIQRGRVKVGMKLGVAGARLQASGEGTEVLDAYGKSYLQLAGNSTHPAPWDARLGLQRQPFVCGLSSLAVDGGLVALLDVVITFVHPIGFQDRNNPRNTWNEAEEDAKAREYKERYESETTRLQEDMSKNLQQYEYLAGLLRDLAEDVDYEACSQPPDDLDGHYDELFESSNPTSLLRSKSGALVIHLARYAALRYNEAVQEERSRLESTLRERCPPRNVRNFRIIRVEDARETRKEKRRTCQINIPDAVTCGIDLTLGKRYLVSNLVTNARGDWKWPVAQGRVAEIALHARRNTVWKPVEATEGAKRGE